MTTLLDWNPTPLSSSHFADFASVGHEQSGFNSGFDLAYQPKDHLASNSHGASGSANHSTVSPARNQRPLSPTTPITVPPSPVHTEYSTASPPVKSEWAPAPTPIMKDDWVSNVVCRQNKSDWPATEPTQQSQHAHSHNESSTSTPSSSAAFVPRMMASARHHPHQHNSHPDRVATTSEHYSHPAASISGNGTIPPSHLHLHQPRHQPHYHAVPPYHIWRGLPAAPRGPFGRPLNVMSHMLDPTVGMQMTTTSEQFPHHPAHMMRPPAPLLIPPHATYSHPGYGAGLPTPPPDHPLHPYARGRRMKSWHGSSAASSAGKIFTCTHEGCGKSFKRAEHLNRHSRMHTGERPFPCDEVGCDRRFSRSDNLAAHKRTHLKHKAKAAAQQAQAHTHMGKMVSDMGRF
ncbi:hypothetical protein SpCBS45565_g07319 [Spizellomyces sp. 'palustris']|nr:hypothetical protein SpCBS45565_g07319 [Spizellomyces sp. 'palustris']